MLTDPVRTYQDLRDAYLRYFDTAFWLRDPRLMTERRSLLEEDGRLFTDPLIPNAAFGMRIDSDQPIVAERAVYFDNGRAGYDSAAIAAPATEWFLPEGGTTGSFEEQLNVLNPQNQPVNVQVDYRPEDGDAPPPQRFSLAATSRLTLDINPQVQDTNVALRVTSDRPIVVERVSYFARAGGLGATSSTGLTR